MHKTIKTQEKTKKQKQKPAAQSRNVNEKKASNNYCTVSVPVCKLLALKWPLWRGYLNSWNAL